MCPFATSLPAWRRASPLRADVIEQAAQPTRHLRTLVTVALEEGRGKQLVTLTAQCRESKHAELSQMLAKVIDSYKPS